jgi:hypothetical protein
MSKTYRTAKGQQLDIGSLLLQNENTRAVGNMGVNARGDKINSQGKVIKGRNEQMQAQYAQVHKQESLAKDQPVYASAKKAQEAALMQPKVQPKEKVEAVEPKAVEETVAKTTTASTKKASGLAGAIAKARSVEQSEELTARQQKQEKEGVKRI